jgi:hypothetical protein
MVESSHARKELNMDNVCEKNDNVKDGNTNYKVDDVDVDENHNIKNEDDELDLLPNRKKKVIN